MRSARVLSSLVIVVTWAGHAGASGISVARFGGEWGNPTTNNATALFYNPAGLAHSEGGHIYGDVTAAFRHSVYQRSVESSDVTPPAGAAGANTGEATLFNVVASPFVGATYKIGSAAFGLAYYTPYGGQSSWNENGSFRGNKVAPGAVDGVQRWYSIEGELRSSFFTAGGAYDFGPIAVGVSGNVVQTIVNTVRARSPSGGDDVRSEGRSWLDVTGYDFSLGAGVSWDAVKDKLRIGVSYQSRPNFGGGIAASGDLRTLFVNGSRDKNSVDFHTDLPDVVRAGASYRVSPKVELRLFGDYQTWSNVRNHCVSHPGKNCDVNADGSAAAGSDIILNQVRDWHDTFGVRAGASYFLSPRVELVGGAGFSSNAIPDRTLEPALLDFNAISAAVGGRFEIVKRVTLAATWTEVFYLSRDTRGKSAHPDLVAPSRGPSSGGEYSQQLGALNVNLDVGF